MAPAYWLTRLFTFTKNFRSLTVHRHAKLPLTILAIIIKEFALPSYVSLFNLVQYMHDECLTIRTLVNLCRVSSSVALLAYTELYRNVCVGRPAKFHKTIVPCQLSADLQHTVLQKIFSCSSGPQAEKFSSMALVRSLYIDKDQWDVSKSDFGHLISQCTSLQNVDVNVWGWGSVLTLGIFDGMSYMDHIAFVNADFWTGTSPARLLFRYLMESRIKLRVLRVRLPLRGGPNEPNPALADVERFRLAMYKNFPSPDRRRIQLETLIIDNQVPPDVGCLNMLIRHCVCKRLVIFDWMRRGGGSSDFNLLYAILECAPRCQHFEYRVFNSSHGRPFNDRAMQSLRCMAGLRSLTFVMENPRVVLHLPAQVERLNLIFLPHRFIDMTLMWFQWWLMNPHSSKQGLRHVTLITQRVALLHLTPQRLVERLHEIQATAIQAGISDWMPLDSWDKPEFPDQPDSPVDQR